MKHLLFVAALLSLPPALDAQCEHLKLTDFDAPPYNGGNNRPDYGRALDMSGDRLAVGVPASGGTDGKVEVYELDGPNWRRMGVITPPPFVSDDFASDVAISGDTLLVADRFAQEVYVYDWDGSAWTFTQMLPSSFATTQFTNYARAVAIDGDQALVSDPRLAGLNGLVFVFERDTSGVWSEVARLGNPDSGNPLPDFGFDLALGSGLAVVGAPRSDAGAGGGAVYVYRDLGFGWEAPTRLDPASAGTKGFYGQAVAVSDGTVLVGDGSSSLASVGAGAVHFWEDQGGTWVEVAAMSSSEAGTVGFGFGEAVDLAGDVAVVGCPDRNAGGGAFGAGGVFVLQDSGSGWTETDVLVPADRGLGDGIGAAVATDGAMIAMGGPGDDDEGPDFGAVYTFSLPGTVCPTLESFPKRLSVAAGGVFTMLLRPGFAFADQDYIVVGSHTGTAPGFFLDGLFFPLNQDDWFNLVLQNPNRFLFGGTVGTLDAAGRATATFTLPGGLPPGLAGLRFHWAYAVFDAQDGSTLLVSTPVQLRLDV